MHYYGVLNCFLLLDTAEFALGIIAQYNEFYNALFLILISVSVRKLTLGNLRKIQVVL